MKPSNPKISAPHVLSLLSIAAVLLQPAPSLGKDFERLQYRHPDLSVDVGVGLWAWPMPIDFDSDGDLDLVVACPDKPFNGIYFFENPSGRIKHPVFRAPVRIDRGISDLQVSYVEGQPRVLGPGIEYFDFRNFALGKPVKLPVSSPIYEKTRKIRGNQWSYADFDGDRVMDLIIGYGDWTDYGWDNAYDSSGAWTNGPLHGYITLLHNSGSNESPSYDSPAKIYAGSEPIDVYGMPSPNLADFDGDGDLDILCGEFLDGLTYFENSGSRAKPKYESGKKLASRGRPLAMDLQMIVPTAIDWDHDGDVDLIVGDEDGRVALIEHTGRTVNGIPQFLPPHYFKQEAADLKFGALVTPFSFDWDGDGDDDLICGNTAGYIGFIENLDGQNPPKWAAPKYLEAGGAIIRIQAGPNGSIQGPCEAKWGYTTLSVADWDHDSLPDIVVNSIWGKVVWYRNIGSRSAPRLAPSEPIEIEWKNDPPKPAWNWWNPGAKELVTQWRTTPFIIDFNQDGLNDLVMLDHEGYLALFERKRENGNLILLPGQRTFIDEHGEPLQLNSGIAGKSGRRKFTFADWDQDGRLDLLVNSSNIDWLRNIGTREGKTVLKQMGKLGEDILAGHTTSPTIVDWDHNGIPDLLVGAEDGRFYYLKNPR
ncbi:MAG: VCBS repeat-containing protein [Verrucomicrobia bacterium]|nr:VCBS repeat-containing protein [Verrucomicrobiota bacterium]